MIPEYVRQSHHSPVGRLKPPIERLIHRTFKSEGEGSEKEKWMGEQRYSTPARILYKHQYI